MLRTHALLAATVLSSLLAACGGGGGGGGNNGGTGGGGGTPPPPPTTTNPCATALLADAETMAVGSVAASGVTAGDKRTLIDGNPRGRLHEAMALHREAEEKRRARARAAAVTDAGFGQTAIASPAPDTQDIGEIAVIQDTGDLILPANPYDIRSAGLRFTRSGSGYTFSRIDNLFRATLGNRVTLEDDDSAAVAIPFSFPFYGVAQTAAFVNSDGNITFGEADKASTERNIARLLTGPPRVAPFLADLDPTQGSGRIFVHAAADAYTVTWCSVRGFDSPRLVTTQATLLPDGSVEMKYSDAITIVDAVVGISPGRTGEIALVDLSSGTGSGSGAIAERFAQANTIDTFAVAKKFYATHPDSFDQILLWTDQPLVRDAFAYEITVANEVRGIGQEIFDVSRSLGSAGRLRSLAVMDWLGKYPEDPAETFLGENSTLSVLGQEVGHRWLAYLEFRNHTGARSQALLGRDTAHWSFFFDSDASVMEGNDIEDQAGGQFRTVVAVKRFSRLDQYAMGLVGPGGVPPFFYVESPTGTSRTAESAPSVGVSFTGTRRDVLIEDVVAIHGPRIPSVADSARVHRQAFIYVVTAGRATDAGQVAKLDRIRTAWEAFFLGATEGRMTANTRLR